MRAKKGESLNVDYPNALTRYFYFQVDWRTSLFSKKNRFIETHQSCAHRYKILWTLNIKYDLPLQLYIYESKLKFNWYVINMKSKILLNKTNDYCVFDLLFTSIYILFSFT